MSVLPNPGMSFTPFDPLPASDLNDIVENIEYLNTTLTTDETNIANMGASAIRDHVESGCVITGTGYGSTLGWSMTAGVVWIGGIRYTVASATGSVTASKDTYFDILKPVSGTVASLVNTGGNIVNNNATSPALAANSVRIGIVVSGASSIASVASINQGQETKLLPIISSVPMQVADALGNLICCRDRDQKTLCQRMVTANQATISTIVALTGLSAPFRADGLTKVVSRVVLPSVKQNGGVGSPVGTIWSGTVGSGTQLTKDEATAAAATYVLQLKPTTIAHTPAAGLNTYNAGLATSTNSCDMQASATAPAYIIIERA